MATVTKENYFDSNIMGEYWSVSQFKAFDNCEAAGLAQVRGEYEPEETTSLLVGSYVDAYFSDEMSMFYGKHPDVFNTRTGELKAPFRQADDIIDRIKSDSLMVEYLTGEPQVIRTGELFGVPWKIKIDALHPDKIVDLKVVKDFADIYKDGFGKIPFIQFWGYDVQGAIYQKIEQISSGRTEPLPFYIVAATKEKDPDICVYQLPQWVLDSALKKVEAKIDRFDLIKRGEVEPIRCESCPYCRRTKRLTGPVVYDPTV